MRAVPSQQVGYPVQNRQSQVRRVSLGLRRDFHQLDKVLRQFIRLSRDI